MKISENIIEEMLNLRIWK